MTMLITGGSGKLGTELKIFFQKSLRPSREEMDITNFESVDRYIKSCKPKIIIHSAALTSVRTCEENKKLAWKTNVLGTQHLIKASSNLEIKPYFVYISTACVFFGDASFYCEEDIPYPKNFYSLTKLLGEITVQESTLKNKLIVRTNFISKKPWPYLKAFKDRYGTYLFTDDVCRGLIDLIAAKKTGIVHLCGDRKMSMYELAKKVSPRIKPMTLVKYSGPQLTVDMSLSTKRWKKYKISNV